MSKLFINIQNTRINLNWIRLYKPINDKVLMLAYYNGKNKIFTFTDKDKRDAILNILDAN